MKTLKTRFSKLLAMAALVMVLVAVNGCEEEPVLPNGVDLCPCPDSSNICACPHD